MKIGYSLLLSEYINANSINYSDCINFQIVCPSCKEPIFKVVRDSNGKKLHYLSHFEKDKSYTENCELRVSEISVNHINSKNIESRNQRLKFFLNVFKNTIYNTEYSNSKIAKKQIDKVKNTKSLDKYRQHLYEHSKKIYSQNNKNDLLEHFEFYVNEIKELVGEFYKTSFSIEQQKKIALDIWYHLLSPKAKENYYFLLNHSYLVLISRIEKASKDRTLFDWEIYLHNTMNEITISSKDRGNELISSLGLYKIPQETDWSADNLYDKMSAEISFEMLGCLLRLPYFEILKRAIKKNKKTN
ncbi:MAG: hypothetical protein KKF62_11580 [Bacteroidetes bacterium]|nr:hypothetical protein [Bacteroidota bacterium]MBU1116798.1 hypothetical protein [Bacteroidota bacterium]MBU1799439.1 hypothetical protein [Bacteroidota bacterium]